VSNPPDASSPPGAPVAPEEDGPRGTPLAPDDSGPLRERGAHGGPGPGGAVDTIVAAITAPGAGERAAVRLSGPEAHALASTVLEFAEQPAPGRVAAAAWRLHPLLPVPVTVLSFRAPRSFTGEDVVEIHLLGWPVLVTELLRQLVAAGARPAARGEFSRRALATGRATVGQTLALARLMAARSSEEAAAAAAALTGAPAAGRAGLRDALLDTLARLEAHVDFEEEDTEAVSEAELRAGLQRAAELAQRLVRMGERQASADGETDVVLLGAPNAGKSALFLALCPGASTTVSPVAGTTRDALEARVLRDGRRWRVLDGPGVDAGECPLSPLDRRAGELWLAQLPALAAVLLVDDAAAPATPATRARLAAAAGSRPVLAVLSKADLLPPGAAAARARAEAACAVSAQQRSGLDELWTELARLAPVPAAPDLATAREAQAAARVLPLLEDALSTPLAGALPLVASALREALAHLAETTEGGEDLDEELLDRIFASFCIGK